MHRGTFGRSVRRGDVRSRENVSPMAPKAIDVDKRHGIVDGVTRNGAVARPARCGVISVKVDSHNVTPVVGMIAAYAARL